jgi:hypothetical protein
MSPQLRKLGNVLCCCFARAKPRNKFGSTHVVLINDRDIYELNEDVFGSEDDSLSFPDQGLSKTMKGFLSQAVRFATVDNFQGEEAKFVIVSLVRRNPNNNLGLLRTPNRINVLLSRAQHSMYIFGNMDTTRNVSIWQKEEEILRIDGNTGDTLELCCPRHQGIALLVTTPSDFARLSPEAGCNLLCEKQLRCGHACIAKCDSEMLHEAMFCMSHVQNSRTAANMPKAMWTKMRFSMNVLIQAIKLELACGYVKNTLLCYEHLDPSFKVHKDPTNRVVPGCSHEITVACYVDVYDDASGCTASCDEILTCGHTCSKLCRQCASRGSEKKG